MARHSTITRIKSGTVQSQRYDAWGIQPHLWSSETSDPFVYEYYLLESERRRSSVRRKCGHLVGKGNDLTRIDQCHWHLMYMWNRTTHSELRQDPMQESQIPYFSIISPTFNVTTNRKQTVAARFGSESKMWYDLLTAMVQMVTVEVSSDFSYTWCGNHYCDIIVDRCLPRQRFNICCARKYISVVRCLCRLPALWRCNVITSPIGWTSM